jgi:hypothetical protein
MIEKSYKWKNSSYFRKSSIDRAPKRRLRFFVEGAFMEEATLDHGLDRLPFFLFLLFLSLAPVKSFATTFGPISLADQIEAAQYILHGRVVGNSWVAENRENRRPFTHWKVQVMEQPKGENLGKEVVIRQPGGEIGDMGYHVAGTATFRPGEEIFVNVRDTEEPNIKEVLGMASGKYTVERSETGNSQLRSGLGFLLKNEEGVPYTTNTLLEYIARIKEGKATNGDKSVMVTRGTSDHDHGNPAFKVVVQPGKKLIPAPEPPQSQPEPQNLSDNLEKPTTSTEENSSSSGVSWWWSLMVFPLLGSFLWFLRKD